MSGTVKSTTKKPVAKVKKAPRAASVSAAKTKTAPAKKTVKSVKKPVAKKPKAVKVTRPAGKSKTAAKTPATAPAVHDVQSLHMPPAPRIKHVRKPFMGEFWMWVSFFFTFLFIYSISENVLNARAGLSDSLSTYAFFPALGIAVGVWKANRTKSTYTGMVIVLSMLGAGLFIWLFGLTSASSLLFS